MRERECVKGSGSVGLWENEERKNYLKNVRERKREREREKERESERVVVWVYERIKREENYLKNERKRKTEREINQRECEWEVERWLKVAWNSCRKMWLRKQIDEGQNRSANGILKMKTFK